MVTSGTGHLPVPVSSGGPLMASRSPHGDAEKIWKRGKSYKRSAQIFSGKDRRWLIFPIRATGRLICCAPQRRLEPLLFFVPVGLFGIQLFLDRLDFGTQRGRTPRMLLLRLVQSRL